MILVWYSRVMGPGRPNPGAPCPCCTSVSETFERAIYPLTIVRDQSTVAFLLTGNQISVQGLRDFLPISGCFLVGFIFDEGNTFVM